MDLSLRRAHLLLPFLLALILWTCEVADYPFYIKPSYEPPGCPPVDIVFIMDTSGSMGDEAVELCNQIQDVLTRLEGEGVEDVQPTTLGITKPLFCATNTVEKMLGSEVPNTGYNLQISADEESWGEATAIVADRFPWREGALRIAVPISDEGPFQGDDPCDDLGDDRNSITNAIEVCNANDVTASPIRGTGSSGCVKKLAEDLAEGTGGISSQSTDPEDDLADSIVSIVQSACDQAAEDG